MSDLDRKCINNSIEIGAPAAAVWRVFTVPEVTRKMGGEYVSDWQVGSALCWRGQDGQFLTNGIILEIEPAKLLKHKLFNPNASATESIITYRFDEDAGHTTLSAREEFPNPLSESEYADAGEGWQAALGFVKAIAEQE